MHPSAPRAHSIVENAFLVQSCYITSSDGKERRWKWNPRRRDTVCKVSYHLDQPHEPISVRLRWPSQSWQGTQRGWGSLDWRWRIRSSLVLEPLCPLAGPQQEPGATTMCSQHYSKNSTNGMRQLRICANCRYAQQPALIMVWCRWVGTQEANWTSLSLLWLNLP